jgi:PTH1 family peptidyl-tRNA hydrolase
MANLLKELLRKAPQMSLENNKALVVGLWNPQEKYSKTRHNIGADILNHFVEKNKLNFKVDKSGSFKITNYQIDEFQVDVVLPLVSMNNSGDALKSYFRYNNVNKEKILIVHDDIDLAFGRLRIKNATSDGGHNGIKSIDKTLGTNEYFRLKVGVGRPPNGIDPAQFVLSKFFPNEHEEVEFIIEDSIDIIKEFVVDKESAIKSASERRIIDVV